MAFFQKKARKGDFGMHPKELQIIAKGEEAKQKDGQISEMIFGRIVNGLIFLFLSLLFLGMPLFFTGATLQGVIFDRYMFFLIFALLAFVTWVAGGVYFGKLEIRRTPLDIPLVLFWAVYGASMFFSKDMWHSFTGVFSDPSRGFIVVTASVLLYYVVMSTQNAKSLYRLAGFFVAGLSLFAVWSTLAVSGVLQGKTGVPTFFSAIPMDDFLSLNIVLSMTLPTVFGFLLASVSREKKRNVVVPAILLGVVAIYVYLVASLYLSIALIALFAGMGVIISYISGDIIRISKQWLWLPMVLFLLVLPTIYFLGQSVLAKKGLELNQNVVPGVKVAWEVAKNTLSEKFLLGTGPSTYGYAFSHYFPDSLNATNAFAIRLSVSPNYFFEMLVTTGLIGGLAFLGLIVFALSVAVYLLTRKRGINSILSLGLWVSILVLAIMGCFYGISGSVIFPGILIAIMGMAALVFTREQGLEARSVTLSLRAAPQYALASTLLLLIACVGGLALFATLGKVYVADIYAGKAYLEQGRDKVRAIQYVEKAIALNNREGHYFVLRGKLYLDVANEKLAQADKKGEKISQEVQQIVNESVFSIAKGRELLPGNVSAQESLAQVLESLGSFDDEFAVYQEAQKIEPKNPAYPVKMAQIRIAQGLQNENVKDARLAEAEKLVESALALKPDYGDAFVQKALLWEVRKNLDKAVEFSQKALQYNRDVQTGLLVARILQERNADGDTQAAENILNSILGVNDKELNAQLSLAGLYEKTGRTQDAIDRYAKVRDMLPDSSDEAKKQLGDIIEKLKNGNVRAEVEEKNIIAPSAR